MNRLATRLAVAMMAVAVLSLLVITAVQVAIVGREFRRLPAGVRVRVEALRPEGREGAVLVLPERFAGPPRPADPGRGVPPVTDLDFARGFRRFQDAQARALTVGLGAAALLSIGVAALLARTVARPIERVSDAAARVARGDLAARVPERAGASESARLARDFNAMAATLERAERERRAMIADVAHELRTPLAAMQGRLEALQDGLLPFDAGEAERLHRQTALLTRLVEDLRTLSLADAGRLTLVSRPTDLARLAADALEAQRARAGREGVRLELDAPAPAPLRADPDRLQQVLANLLDNAVRVTPEGGAVRLRVRADEAGATAVVEDEGPGIPAEDLPLIFDRFVQGKDERRGRTRGGSGLGLAIAQALVALHGGALAAANRSEGGAAFTVTLPVAPPGQSAAAG